MQALAGDIRHAPLRMLPKVVRYVGGAADTIAAARAGYIRPAGAAELISAAARSGIGG